MTSLRHRVLTFGNRSGLITQIRHIWGVQRFTVLAYHRVTNLDTPEFDLFVPNVSATPQVFASQMDYVKKYFHVVSLEDVAAAQKGERPLPPNPLLITFDDGYLDNLENAFPILQQHGFPATIFLATHYIGEKKPFFWDLIAYCFNHTEQNSVVLPFLGTQQWANEAERTAVMNQWLSILKTVPNAEKETAVEQLPALLDVDIPEDTFAKICLTWDQVRMMAQAGITFGAHTQNHPILTRVSLAEAKKEIIGSKMRIEAETGKRVVSFAYPNGQSTDYNDSLKNILKEAEIDVAFTLLHGPAKPAEVRQDPFAIRRIFIENRDDMPRFAAKVMGLTRLIGIPS